MLLEPESKIWSFQVYQYHDVTPLSPESRSVQYGNGQRSKKDRKNKRDEENKKSERDRRNYWRNKINWVVKNNDSFRANDYYQINYL